MSAIATQVLPEQVLVVPRASVLGRASWQGFRTLEVDDLLASILREGRYEPRPAVESDPHWKQVIPYLVLRDGDRWFLMRRTRAGADARLHERWSIGVGGHLNPGDLDLAGGLDDDETDVGAVHFGVVYEADAAGRAVAVRELDKLSGAFADEEEVAAVRDRLESWSELVFEALRVRTRA